MKHHLPRRLAAAATAALLATPAFAQAPPPDIAQVRSTTTKLITMLVEQGVLTRSRAEALLKEVEAPAVATAATPAAGTAGGKPASAVRVPYVPEFVRKEIKDELRTELVAQAAREGWAGPGAVPEWTRGIKWEGDLRARFQSDDFDAANGPAVNITETNRTRALALLNTTEDRQRLRVRARIGLTATLDENWSAGVRLSTGSSGDPNSSNQTLGNYGNRYTVALDRAFARYRYDDRFNVVLGRFGNPWFGTDVLWANDLSFDGVAAQWSPKIGPARGFLTVAAMPIQEVELSTGDKWLFGAQLGADIAGSGPVRAKFGLGYYHYSNIAGQANAPGSSLNDFTSPAFAQKGNTYFNISSDPTRPLLALASDFRIVNLTGLLDIASVAGKHVLISGDWARNLGFDRAAVSARTGLDVEGQTDAFGFRLAFGDPDVQRRQQWQVFFGYKHVERDAVLDAFTDGDLRLGGTDAKGYVLGGTYGFGKNAAATLRWLSGESISGAPLAVDVLHLDLSVRF